MCCFALLLGLLGPRVAFVFAWLFTDRVERAFDGSFFVPLLGLIFLPWTALAYIIAWAPAREVTGFGWVLVGLAIIADITSYSGSARRRARMAH